MLLSAFFSGMEIASLSSGKLSGGADRKYRSAVTAGNIIALVVYTLLMAVLLSPVIAGMTGHAAFWFLLVLSATLLVLFAGEFVPLTVFRVINQSAEHPFGKVDLDYILQQSLEDKEKSDMGTEVKMLQNALDFSNVRLRDCMIPRTEIIACDTHTGADELRAKFIETGLSKIVVYNENIDDVIGYIHSSELFKHPEDWTQSIQSVPIVPETMAANKLMKTLMQDKKSLTVVVDEFGGTAGLVTLEDLVEEIFGEIEDEHDTKTHIAKKVAENEYILSGRLEIDTLDEMFGLGLPESDEYVTVAGFILHYYQRFPKLNETVVIDKYTFKIMKVSATKIELVRMKVEI